MVKFLCDNLFETSLRDRFIIIVTNSEQKLVEEKKEAQDWLDRESADGNGESPFSMCYDLIERDSNKVVFVDNNNVESVSNAETCIRYKQENVRMAQKVLDVVHKETIVQPVSIQSAVKRTFESIKEIDERIEKEENEKERQRLGRF